MPGIGYSINFFKLNSFVLHFLTQHIILTLFSSRTHSFMFRYLFCRDNNLDNIKHVRCLNPGFINWHHVQCCIKSYTIQEYIWWHQLTENHSSNIWWKFPSSTIVNWKLILVWGQVGYKFRYALMMIPEFILAKFTQNIVNTCNFARLMHTLGHALHFPRRCTFSNIT